MQVVQSERSQRLRIVEIYRKLENNQLD
jgi:hypothetical protein